MSVLINILLTCGVATLLALWCGWGLARLTLPASLQPWSGLIAPLMGYALVLVAGYWGVRDWVGIIPVLSVLIPAVGLLNALAWRRTGPPLITKQPLAHLPLLLLLLVTLLVGVAPIISYGHPAIIGANWDVENYLPVSRYLERGPISAIPSAPPNPLRDLNAHPPSIGLTLGFSTWQGSIDTLTGQEAITTFAPLLAWLRMLGIVAVYVLFRSVMGLNRWFALLGAAFVSAGGLLLWVEYFNFGMQMAAWPLIPFGLVVGTSAIEGASERGGKSWPCVLGAAVALAALPVAYYPALTLFAPLAAGLGIAIIVRSKQRLPLILGVGALALATLLLSIPAILDYFQGFSFRYGQQLTSLGLFRYVPLTDFVGLTPFSLRSDSPVPIFATIALAVLAALMLVGLVMDSKRTYWAGLALGGAAYMLWLWSQQYPYAWMKGGAYAAFPFLGLAAAGAQTLATGRQPLKSENREDTENSKLKTQNSKLLRSGIAIAVSLAAFIIMAVTQLQTVADNWQTPGLYAKELPALLGLRAQIPPGSKVTLTSDPRINGVTTALVAYMLDQNTILGSATTGYVPEWSNGAPDEVGDYALLSDGEDPHAVGFGNTLPLWQGGGFTLYPRSSATVAHLQLDRTLAPGDVLTLPFNEKRLGQDIAQAGTQETRSLSLRLAAFSAGKLMIDGKEIAVPAGGSEVISGIVDTPNTLSVTNNGTTPILVRWATLGLPSDAKQIRVVPAQNIILSQAHASETGMVVTTTINTLSPAVGPVTYALDVWDHKRAAHYGWYGVEQPRAEAEHAITFTLDLKTGAMTGADPTGAPLSIGGELEGLQRGDYTASLNVLAGTQLLTAPEDVFTFSIDAKKSVSNVHTVTTPLVVAPALPATSVGIIEKQERGAQLQGYTVDNSAAHPGGEIAVTLWWTSGGAALGERSVLFHLSDLKGEKRAEADGPPAGGGRPTTTWQTGETVIDKHTLKIPADIPSGQYSLIIGMYQYPALQPIPFSEPPRASGDTFDRPWHMEGDTLLIPIDIKK